MATEAQTCATGIFPNPACRGVASGEAGSSLASLHLSRTLYKSTLFMQNKPNFRKAKMNVSIVKTMNYKNFIPLAGQKNKPNSNPILSAVGGLPMAKMNVNAFLQKDYENEPPSGSKKTKPKQTQSCPP
ncbi:MAG TPA: hypothetical protein VMW72_17870 [Sedimentisphaerales bacterium]|nr:hypothetical protein [Sedimentisphaerales bacterium]